MGGFVVSFWGRDRIICKASTHTALVSSASLAVLHLSTYLPTYRIGDTPKGEASRESLGEAGRKWPISPTTLSNAGMPSKTGIDAVSAETVSFHLKTFGSVKEISRALLRYLFFLLGMESVSETLQWPLSVLNGDCDPQPAREVERVTESRGVTAITTPQRCRSLPVAPHQFRVADRPHRLLLLSTPKAGATITTQMMFSFLNLSMAALNYSRWIHDFRQRVFEYV